MKILLLGGSGIISSEICSLSLNRGNNVTIVNRGKRKDKIDDRAKLIVCDLKNESEGEIISKLDFEGYDVIVDFISYHRSQLTKMLSIARGRCKQFIFFSSATAYLPKENDTAYVESDPIGNTGWQYAAEKAECEKLLQSEAPKLGIEYTIIRPYITYGDTRIPYQVIPIKYYTLVNRIINNKPIPIFGNKINCTLTHSPDFAIGAVGLFLNPCAFGEAFHIVGDSVTTWDNVIKTIGDIIGVDAILTRFKLTDLHDGSRRLGFDVDEILYDKGRNMVFDNSKIKAAVPEFNRFTTYYDGIKMSIDHFNTVDSLKVIDYAWDARIDRFIERFSKANYNRSLTITAYNNQLTIEDIKTYRNNRSDISYIAGKVFGKITK